MEEELEWSYTLDEERIRLDSEDAARELDLLHEAVELFLRDNTPEAPGSLIAPPRRRT